MLNFAFAGCLTCCYAPQGESTTRAKRERNSDKGERLKVRLLNLLDTGHMDYGKLSDDY